MQMILLQANACKRLTSLTRLELSGESSGHLSPAHVQILFVDRSDTVRARVAAGLLERVAEWNGYGRALYPSACGVEATQVWRLLLLQPHCACRYIAQLLSPVSRCDTCRI